MKRQAAALACAVLLLASLWVPQAGALAGEETRAADTLSTLGLVHGTGGSSGYALSGTADRYTAAVMLARLSGCEAEAAGSGYCSPFTDVAAWARNAVNLVYAKGWAMGTSDHIFSGTKALTANACCAFLLRMLGYCDADGDFSPNSAAVFARRIGLLTKDYDGVLTRGELFSIFRDALTFPYQSTEETVIQRLISKGAVTRAAANALGLLTEELTARQIADRCSAAVFLLDNYESQLSMDAQTPSSNATGFFISSDGLAVTNYHAIAYSLYSTATLVTGESYPVERVLYYDSGVDLAIIKVSLTSTQSVKTSAFATLDMVSAKDVRNGDTVYALGNSLGLGLSVSAGVIANNSKKVNGYTLPMLQNTADISMGNSGGVLFNVYGQVIGITTGAYTFGNSMYLSIPSDAALGADVNREGWTLQQVTAIQKAADQAAESKTA